MNTSLENLTHKMQRAALGKIVDVALSHAEQDREKTMTQLVDVAKQFYGSGFSDETYENAKKVLTDPDSKWTKLINCVPDFYAKFRLPAAAVTWLIRIASLGETIPTECSWSNGLKHVINHNGRQSRSFRRLINQ